jgi:EAL domain-containing protein (putative c-di-GMP-specific phosphodiesterase class I)
MQQETMRRLALESDIIRGLDEGQFTMFYQPIVDARSSTVLCLEALMRWRHAERGLVLPSDFIQLAEDCGLIVPLTEFAVRDVCRQLSEWRSAGLPEMRVAVNVSAKVIEVADVAGMIETSCVAAGLPVELIELELTESVLMTQQEAASSLFKRLRRLGVRISIDDFGTGYSSLAYIKSMPIDALKIDISFVRDIDRDSSSAAIIRTIIAMGSSLGFRVIAEGVETETQREFLVRAGCDMLQGYLVGPPVSAEEISDQYGVSPIPCAAP